MVPRSHGIHHVVLTRRQKKEVRRGFEFCELNSDENLPRTYMAVTAVPEYELELGFGFCFGVWALGFSGFRFGQDAKRGGHGHVGKGRQGEVCNAWTRTHFSPGAHRPNDSLQTLPFKQGRKDVMLHGFPCLAPTRTSFSQSEEYLWQLNRLEWVSSRCSQMSTSFTRM